MPSTRPCGALWNWETSSTSRCAPQGKISRGGARPPTVETPRGASPQRRHPSRDHSWSAVYRAAFPLGGDAPRGVSTVVGRQAVVIWGLSRQENRERAVEQTRIARI